MRSFGSIRVWVDVDVLDREPGVLQVLGQLPDRPGVGSRHRVRERLEPFAGEEADDHCAVGPEAPSELLQDGGDRRVLEMDGRVPGQDPGYRPVGPAQLVEARHAIDHGREPDPGRVGKGRNEVDPFDVSSSLRQEVGPVPGPAPGVDDGPPAPRDPARDDLAVTGAVAVIEPSRVMYSSALAV